MYIKQLLLQNNSSQINKVLTYQTALWNQEHDFDLIHLSAYFLLSNFGNSLIYGEILHDMLEEALNLNKMMKTKT